MGKVVYDAVDDQRAISDDFFEKFEKSPMLNYIVEKIRSDNPDSDKKIKEESQRYILLMRGNSGDERVSETEDKTKVKTKVKTMSGQVTVYYNNHALFDINNKVEGFTIVIHMNHCKTCRESVMEKLIELKFDINPKNSEKSEYIRKNCPNGNEMTNKDIDELFEILQKMMDNYFTIRTKVGNPVEWEKQRQQQIFSDREYMYKKLGYFIYDLEYTKPHLIKGEVDPLKNKADFLAIRYEEDKPVALVFGEIKTTETACKDNSSGIKEHLERMVNFYDGLNGTNEYQALASAEFDVRKKDAYKLLDQYRKLGLYGITEKQCEDLKKADLKMEILMVFTDQAIGYWHNWHAGSREIIGTRKNIEKTHPTFLSVINEMDYAVPLRFSYKIKKTSISKS